VLKKKFKKEALTFIEKLAMVCNLVAFSNEKLEEAINLMRQNSNFKDLEDTLQYLLAKRVECDLILSNDGGFYSPDIKVLSAKKLLGED